MDFTRYMYAYDHCKHHWFQIIKMGNLTLYLAHSVSRYMCIHYTFAWMAMIKE